MRIAFYAPMKPPTHAVPSGDRRMSRLLMAALRAGGHRVEIASRFRSYDGAGDAARQLRLQHRGRLLSDRLIESYCRRTRRDRPEAWFTYHVYHKAPDWLGPPVSEALGIPYVIAEASHAPKQIHGSWQQGHAAAAAAIRNAERIFCLNSNDIACLRSLTDGPERLVPLKPFLEASPRPTATREQLRSLWSTELDLDPRQVWLLAVGMMRPGDKLESYRRLGEALARLTRPDWQLIVVGDGPARMDVEVALSPIARARVRYAGEVTADILADLYAATDIMVWPAVREAYGMALLEAQAAGLPVIAGRSGGVPDIVIDGETGLLVAPDDTGALASAVTNLLSNPARRARMADAAHRRMRAGHDIAAAAALLDRTLTALVATKLPAAP